jgi:hypothetical protein
MKALIKVKFTYFKIKLFNLDKKKIFTITSILNKNLKLIAIIIILIIIIIIVIIIIFITKIDKTIIVTITKISSVIFKFF